MDAIYFKEELLAWEPELRAYALRMTGHAEDAEDVVQEAYERAWAARGRFRKGTDAYAWLRVIAVNLWRNRRNARQRHRAYVEGVERAIEQGHVVTTAPAATLPLADTVVCALAEVPPNRVYPLLLHALFGYEKNEIGELLGVPYGTILSRTNRAAHALRVTLAQYAQEEYGIRYKKR